jgi:carbamoyltransferase
MKGALLGPAFDDAAIERFLDATGARYERLDHRSAAMRVAELLAEGRIVGWFSGRMEFGPRALGARSILGDPRSPTMQSEMNLKIKFRESFRPFAPSVLRERAGDWFELDGDSPYMLIVAPVKRERQLPAVTHVDETARVQTVGEDANPEFRELLRAFEALTGCPVLVNTSFNVRGEPIVCTPEDAYRCFMRTNIDYLVLGPFLLAKAEQRDAGRGAREWQAELQLD